MMAIYLNMLKFYFARLHLFLFNFVFIYLFPYFVQNTMRVRYDGLFVFEKSKYTAQELFRFQIVCFP
jgi:hypothetical protein